MPETSRSAVAWRVAGALALGLAGLSSLAHQTAAEAAASSSASIWELLFGLLSFSLASLGVLLLIHGRRLFEPPTR